MAIYMELKNSDGETVKIKNLKDLEEYARNTNDEKLLPIFERIDKFGLDKDKAFLQELKNNNINDSKSFENISTDYLKGVGLKPLAEDGKTPLQEVVLDSTTGKPVQEYVLDAKGNKIEKKDKKGNPVLDSAGNPVYETKDKTQDIVFHNGKELMEYLEKNDNPLYTSLQQKYSSKLENFLYDEFIKNEQQSLEKIKKELNNKVAEKSQENTAEAKEMLRSNRNRALLVGVPTVAAGLVLADTLGALSLSAIGGAAGNAALAGLTALGSGLIGFASIPIALTIPGAVIALGAAYFIKNRKKIWGRDPEIANARIQAKLNKLDEKEKKLDHLRELCPFEPGTPKYNRYMNKIKGREKNAQLKQARYMTKYMKKQVKEFEVQEKKLRSPYVSEKQREKIMEKITKSKENMEKISTEFARMQDRAVKNQFKPVEGRSYADSLWQNKNIQLKGIKDNFDPSKQRELSGEEKKYVIALFNDIKAKDRNGKEITFDGLGKYSQEAVLENGRFIMQNYNAIKSIINTTKNPYVPGTPDYTAWKQTKIDILCNPYLTIDVDKLSSLHGGYKELKQFHAELDKKVSKEMEGNISLGQDMKNMFVETGTTIGHVVKEKVSNWAKKNKTVKSLSEESAAKKAKEEEFHL